MADLTQVGPTLAANDFQEWRYYLPAGGDEVLAEGFTFTQLSTFEVLTKKASNFY
jgi:hypothetical protein